MDWNQKYIEKQKEKKHTVFRDVVNNRIRRFISNTPIKPEHFSELEYLIINYDYNKSLFNKYGDLISEEVKNEWIERKLKNEVSYPNKEGYDIYIIMLPFYLISPNTNNEKIDRYFLQDQLILSLGSIDNKFKKYRLRAKKLFKFITPNFKKLNPNLRKNIVKILTVRTTTDNILIIKCLILKNWKLIDEELINYFLEIQFQRKLITPKMAIGIFKRRMELNEESIECLKQLILTLEKGEYILEKINPAPNILYTDHFS